MGIVIVIFVVAIFLGFSLGIATMALVSARRDFYLQYERAQEVRGHLTNGYYPIYRFNRSLSARPRTSEASCLIAP